MRSANNVGGFNMCEIQVDEDGIIEYQNFVIPMSEIIERYRRDIMENREIEILPFIYLRVERKLFNKKYIIKCLNSIDSFFYGNIKKDTSHVKEIDKKIDYINADLGWVNVDDISYSTYLHCDVIDAFKIVGFIINCDNNKYAPFSEIQVWEMTQENKPIFNEICMKCKPCKTKVNYKCGTYDLDEKVLYAKNVFCEINELDSEREIVVDNNNGGLMMAEGKHRICLCKKLHYKKMLAKIINRGLKSEEQKFDSYNRTEPQATYYHKTIRWFLICKEFYNFYLNKLKISEDDLKQLYCDTSRKEFICKLEKMLSKNIIEIIKLKEIRERQKNFDFKYFANDLY